LAELAANDQALSPAIYTEAVLRAALAAYEAFPDSDDGAAAVAVAARVLIAQPFSGTELGLDGHPLAFVLTWVAAHQCRGPRAPREPGELQRMVAQVRCVLPIVAPPKVPARSPRSALAWLWLAAALAAVPAGDPAPALDALATMLRGAGPLCR